MKQKLFKEYTKSVCKSVNIDAKTLFTKTKRRDVVDARFLLYYICFERPIKNYYPYSRRHHRMKPQLALVVTNMSHT